jgi:phage baseplate assembly protein W
MAGGSKGFLGQGWAFPPRFDRARGEVVMVSDVADIHDSLRILFSTMLRERTMLPRYGAMLEQLVFEPIDATLCYRIEDLVREAVLLYEPRIVLDNVAVELATGQDGRVDVRLDYTIEQTNVRSNMVYPFYFLEGSNVRAIGAGR